MPRGARSGNANREIGVPKSLFQASETGLEFSEAPLELPLLGSLLT